MGYPFRPIQDQTRQSVKSDNGGNFGQIYILIGSIRWIKTDEDSLLNNLKYWTTVPVDTKNLRKALHPTDSLAEAKGGGAYSDPLESPIQNTCRRLPETETASAPSLSMMAGGCLLALGVLLGYRCLRRFRKREPKTELVRV